MDTSGSESCRLADLDDPSWHRNAGEDAELTPVTPHFPREQLGALGYELCDHSSFFARHRRRPSAPQPWQVMVLRQSGGGTRMYSPVSARRIISHIPESHDRPRVRLRAARWAKRYGILPPRTMRALASVRRGQRRRARQRRVRRGDTTRSRPAAYEIDRKLDELFAGQPGFSSRRARTTDTRKATPTFSSASGAGAGC